LFWLALLVAAAFLFILGGAGTIVFLADRDRSTAGYSDCGAFPLTGAFVLALGCIVLILIAAVAISFFCYRAWNSVD
jgi:hypothetical protein